MQKIDITGQRFGRLIVLRENGRKGKSLLWLCRCDCGNEINAIAYNLKNGHTRSCGCLAKDTKSKIRTKHNGTKTRLFRIWQHMLNRCRNKNVVGYKNYGGRGIKVCNEWQKSFESFRDWALRNGYKDDLSLDRINVNGNYEPENCRWTNAKTQANNKRNNRYIEYKGETKTLSEWAESFGLLPATIRARLNVYHWDIEKTLTTPSTNLNL